MGSSLIRASARVEQIRDEDQYAGIRVRLTARLATAVIRFHIDVNIGDPIWPEPTQVLLPRLLGGEIELRGYPLEMVLAEKIVTALERATANTRWRDFADIYLLARTHMMSAKRLSETIRTVAEHRSVVIRPLRQALDGYAELAQSRWSAWRRKQALDGMLPEQFADVLMLVIRFVDPILDSGLNDGARYWRTHSLNWEAA